jgi:Mn2+/Fe2+ NRAMP family transporter
MKLYKVSLRGLRQYAGPLFIMPYAFVSLAYPESPSQLLHYVYIASLILLFVCSIFVLYKTL